MGKSAQRGDALSELTGADALFESLVDSVAAQVRSPQPGVSAQQLRTRLLAFRPRFDAVYLSVLQEHLGNDLAALVKVLREPRVQAYFGARRSMAPELGRLLQELSLEMGETQL
jgi:hypothetical protein